jgi:hypothetical protein
MATTTTRPACPYPCAGSGCPHIRSDAECIACEARPALDAHYRALDAWHEAQELDHTGSSHPYFSPALAGWGGGDR